jgi:hypothetical protein
MNIIVDRVTDVFPGSLKNVYAGELLFLLAAFTIANSLLSFYWRLASKTSMKGFRYTLYVVIIVNTAIWLGFFLMNAFQCR